MANASRKLRVRRREGGFRNARTAAGSAERQRWVGVGMMAMNLAMLTVATTMLVGRSYNPFLYFRF